MPLGEPGQQKGKKGRVPDGDQGQRLRPEQEEQSDVAERLDVVYLPHLRRDGHYPGEEGAESSEILGIFLEADGDAARRPFFAVGDGGYGPVGGP
jgi:hypothetical protein